MKQLMPLIASTLLIFGVLFSPTGATAAVVTFVESPDGVPPGTTVPDIQASVTGSDVVAGSVEVTTVEGQSASEARTIRFTVAGPTVSFDPFSNIFLLEPNSQVISDRINVSGSLTTGGLRVTIDFTSDTPENTLGTASGFAFFGAFETGGQVTPFDTAALPAGVVSPVPFALRINATSDIEAVPEPATLLLLGAGLAGLGALGFRRAGTHG